MSYILAELDIKRFAHLQENNFGYENFFARGMRGAQHP